MTTENLNNESVVVNKYDNIQYKKSNPFILGKLSNNSKFHLIYNVIKAITLLLVFIFALLSLWYTTQWKENTLVNLGIDLNSKLNLIQSGDGTTNPVTEAILQRVTEANALSLGQWSSLQNIFNSSIIDILVAFSFVGIVAIIPSLVFKNGTIYSLISMVIAFVSFIVILTLFSICLIHQNEVVQIYRSTGSWENNDLIMANVQKILDLVLGPTTNN